MKTIHEIVRKNETDFIVGNTQISKYVNHSLNDTLEKIDAYSNSIHISGDFDSQGREKPFFDIVTAATNIWYRATDIDRKNINITGEREQDFINSLIASYMLRKWMNKSIFGIYLNDWGKTLAKYGSAVTKTVVNKNGLNIAVIPWNTLIVDAVDFDASPQIEIIELSESQLRRRIETHGYDKEAVNDLLETTQSRETKEGQRVDNKTGFIKLYELHGFLSKEHLTDDRKDRDVFIEQMHIISFVADKKTGKDKYRDFTLYKGEEEENPYSIAHLIKEEGRTLAKGSVENLFEAQWMQNYSVKSIKDQLDLASKMFFQTSDTNFMGMNAMTDLENGEIFIHESGKPITQVNNGSHDITSQQNFAAQWKSLGNEINGVSEAMMGTAPKSGTAWRQTEAMLQESHSLFELMTENKGLALEELLRIRVLPYFKEKIINNTDDIALILDSHDLNTIDTKYIKSKASKIMFEEAKKDLISGKTVQPQEVGMVENGIRQELANFGNKRFFKTGDIDKKTWTEQFKDMEWDLNIDITGEGQDKNSMMATLNTALQVVANPNYGQNPQAKVIIGKILEMTGAMSPLEVADMSAMQQPINQQPAPTITQ